MLIKSPLEVSKIQIRTKRHLGLYIALTGCAMTFIGYFMAVGVSMGNIKHMMDGTVNFLINVFYVGVGVILVGIIVSIQQFFAQRPNLK